ncbi:hypothetical protein, partial [Chitinilyticum litopenaei]|uniref:hypothetical protein n=1 Tax=Chitinilyticum litopenaei TaxID=1121276 RepID=UPI0011868765
MGSCLSRPVPAQAGCKREFLRIQLHTLYDRRGRISNQRALQPGGSVQRERRYAWLPDGELGSDDHSHYGRRQYQYDPAGRLLRQTQQHGGSSE